MNDTLTPTAARVTGVAAMLAPVLLLLSSVAYLTQGGGVNDGVLGGTIGVWSTIALVVATVGITRLAEPQAPRAAAVVQLVAIAGFTAGVAFNVQAMYLAKYGNDFLLDVTEGESEGGDWIGFFAFLPWGWLAPLGFVLMGWLLWRTRVMPTWACALLVLGGVMFVAGRPARIDALVVATDVVLVVALAAIGVRLLASASHGADTPEGAMVSRSGTGSSV